MTLLLQAMIAIAIIITTILENIIAYLQEIPETTRKAAQAITRKPVGFMQSCCFVFVGILNTYK